MRLGEPFRECVGFLFRGESLVGSAFIVGLEVREQTYLYVVTAGHLATPGDDLILRANNTSGGAIRIPIDHGNWRRPESPVVDLAVARLVLDPSDMLQLALVTDQHLATTQFLVEHDVGPGDDVAFVGLFSGSPGSERNLPILRFGNIARMNEELVPTDYRGGQATLDAIMVEGHSHGGQSGSPAFVLFPASRSSDLPDFVVPDRLRSVALLGVVSGHWMLPQAIVLKNTTATDTEAEVPINAGIALVTPAQHIHDVLFRADVVAERADSGH